MSGELIQYVIYEKPADYREGFVVRKWHITSEAARPGMGCFCHALHVARECVPEGMVNIGRMKSDDPTIVEVWT